MHAAQTLAGQRVTVGEQHVGIRVVVAMAQLTLTAEHHGVAIVTGGTPESAATNGVNVGVMGKMYFWCRSTPRVDVYLSQFGPA